MELVETKYMRISSKEGIENQLNELNILVSCNLELSHLSKESISSEMLNRHFLIIDILYTSTKQQNNYNLEMYYYTCLMGLLNKHTFIFDSNPDMLSIGLEGKSFVLAYRIFEDAEGHYLKKESKFLEALYNYCSSKVMDILIPSKINTPFDFNGHETHLILSLYEKCNSYRYTITFDDIIKFLKQFSTKELALSVLNILNTELMFFRLNHLSELVSSALVSKDITEYNFSVFGEHDGSSSIINYLLGHSEMAVDESYFQNIEDALDKGKTICFVDDCLLSGTQAIVILQSYPESFDLKNTSLIFTFAIAMDEGINKLNNYLKDNDYKDFEILYGTTLIEGNKILESSKNHLYQNKEQRISLKEELKNIGYEILEKRANEKGWNNTTRIEHSLGYGNKQKMLVFEYGIPKSTLTFLWEKGKYHNMDWTPLFSHYKH